MKHTLRVIRLTHILYVSNMYHHKIKVIKIVYDFYQDVIIKFLNKFIVQVFITSLLNKL